MTPPLSISARPVFNRRLVIPFRLDIERLLGRGTTGQNSCGEHSILTLRRRLARRVKFLPRRHRGKEERSRDRIIETSDHRNNRKRERRKGGEGLDLG